MANDLADVLLEDLSRALPGEYKTITAMALLNAAKFGKRISCLTLHTMKPDAYHRTCVQMAIESNM